MNLSELVRREEQASRQQPELEWMALLKKMQLVRILAMR